MTTETKRPNEISWTDLFLAGSIFHLRTSSWRAREQIKAADLGIKDTAEVTQALALGQHRLIPGEAFKPIEAAIDAARKAIEDASLPFMFIPGARYVPEKNSTTLLAKLKVCRGAYDDAVAAFIEAYPATSAQMMVTIKRAIEDATRDPETVDAAFQRVVSHYPTAADLAERFRMSWSIYAIQGPKASGASAAAEAEADTVRSVVREMVSGLREEVTTKLAGVLKLIQTGGKLQERSVESALAVLDRVESVNILGDEVLTTQVRSLRAALKNIETGKRISDATVAGLETIKVELEKGIADAAAAAEAKLSGQGRRRLKIEMAPEGSAA